MKVDNPKIIVIAGGFYYFGDEVTAPEGYVALKKGAMFRGFSGGKGLPGVARGDKKMTVNLDTFEPEETLIFPIAAVYGILPCINLYEFKGSSIDS